LLATATVKWSAVKTALIRNDLYWVGWGVKLLNPILATSSFCPIEMHNSLHFVLEKSKQLLLCAGA